MFNFQRNVAKTRLIYRQILSAALLSLTACSGASEDSTSSTNVDDSASESVTADTITAIHRSGQTFLTWPETSGARYHIYRHIEPINKSTIAAARRLTGKWGNLGTDTSVNLYGTDNVPANFVIEDLGTPLSESTGFFVYTIPENRQGDFFYAVTNIIDGEEDMDFSAGSQSLSSAVSESSATPSPVLVASTNNDKSRIYQQYMDYDNWNPTLNGYAYDFGVTLPHNYDPKKSYPLQLVLHAFGENYKSLPETEYNWEVIQLRPSDPGPPNNSYHSWWYGFSSDHNYQTTRLPPMQGTVNNFTEQRVLAATRFVLNSPDFNTNEELTHIVGNSMGASGAVSFGLRYPAVFSGIYASQPMTNYASSPLFQDNFVALWGKQQSNLPIINGGTESSTIKRFNSGQSAATGVWDWMNHLQQIDRRHNESFAYLMIDHGKADTTIDWQTQGQPLAEALTNARVGFSANAFGDAGHSWLAFAAVVKPTFGLGFDTLAPWRYPVSMSFPAISHASGSSPVNPAARGDDSYNVTIEWSTPANAFGNNIVDAVNRYEITLRSTTTDQTADITPRRTQLFNPRAGQQCNWTATKLADKHATSGTATVSANGLLTIVNCPIHTGKGTHLVVKC